MHRFRYNSIVARLSGQSFLSVCNGKKNEQVTGTRLRRGRGRTAAGRARSLEPLGHEQGGCEVAQQAQPQQRGDEVHDVQAEALLGTRPVPTRPVVRMSTRLGQGAGFGAVNISSKSQDSAAGPPDGCPSPPQRGRTDNAGRSVKALAMRSSSSLDEVKITTGRVRVRSSARR